VSLDDSASGRVSVDVVGVGECLDQVVPRPRHP
jgi:hypothetical protein